VVFCDGSGARCGGFGMTLRCHACDKSLLRYAVSKTGADGVPYGYGPKCGAAFIVRKKRAVRADVPWRRGCGRVPVRDPNQVDWINAVSA